MKVQTCFFHLADQITESLFICVIIQIYSYNLAVVGGGLWSVDQEKEELPSILAT